MEHLKFSIVEDMINYIMGNFAIVHYLIITWYFQVGRKAVSAILIKTLVAKIYFNNEF